MHSFKTGTIALLGLPNAGKSTLINALIGDNLTAVTPKPQTTRKRFLGVVTQPNAQLIFIDTPGIHHSAKTINQFFISEATLAQNEADVCVYLLPVDQTLDSLIEKMILTTQVPFILALTKTDLPEKWWQTTPGEIEKKFSKKPLLLSAPTKHGLDGLIHTIIPLLPEGPALFPEEDLTNENLRDIATELIRQEATKKLFEEIPYSLMVQLESFKEEPTITRIEATLIIENESQKGIVIGHKGSMIKEIGTESRKYLEKLLTKKVFLALKVKVDKNWTKDPAKIRKYGLNTD